MPTVQQPRRGATRRVLKAAGLALGAVLVSSQAQGAYAADGAVTVQSSCGGAGSHVNSEANGDALCACKPGYSDRQLLEASDPTSTRPQLDCRYCAPGYYLKTPRVLPDTIDTTGHGAVCGEIDQTKLHSTTVNAADIGSDVKALLSAQAPTSVNDCAAGHYGTATGFDGTGCTACPVGGSSAAGSSAVTGCVPDCSSLTVAKDSDGITTLSAGDGIQLVTSPSTGKLDDCETAPGYYLYLQANDADTAGPLQIHKAPANFYAPGQQNVVTGANYFMMASANMVADSSPNALVSACPFGGVSDAASSAVTDCDPDCSETNADSGAVADGLGMCQCAANYYGSFPVDAMGGTSAAASAGCTACPAGGTSTAGTASSSGCTAPPPTTADSAGATTPIAVALATAAAVPLLL
jgi:hypothetical protein